MSIRIDRTKCVGCGKCADICPGNLIIRDGMGRAVLPCPEDCWGCASCLKECRHGAIAYYLGTDMRGNGAETGGIFLMDNHPDGNTLLKFITCGSVDDGKSTLIGHILYDAKLLYADQEQALELDSRTGSRGGKSTTLSCWTASWRSGNRGLR